MSFIEFDKGFTVPEEFDLNMLDSLPIHKHRYGQPMEENPTTLYWTEYQPYQAGDGTISFARKLYLQYPNVAQHVVDYIVFKIVRKVSHTIVSLSLLRGVGYSY